MLLSVIRLQSTATIFYFSHHFSLINIITINIYLSTSSEPEPNKYKSGAKQATHDRTNKSYAVSNSIPHEVIVYKTVDMTLLTLNRRFPGRSNTK